jgi:Fe-S cluster assembly iron-binding protein IscA
MIEITETAEKEIRAILENNPGKYFRIVVEGDGCAGPYLGLSLDEANPYEKTTSINGIDFFISDEVKRHAEITTINIFLKPDWMDLLAREKGNSGF